VAVCTQSSNEVQAHSVSENHVAVCALANVCMSMSAHCSMCEYRVVALNKAVDCYVERKSSQHSSVQWQ
jgi:hypothetical protein